MAMATRRRASASPSRSAGSSSGRPARVGGRVWTKRSEATPYPDPGISAVRGGGPDYPNVRTFKHDLTAAGVAFEDALGRKADFHALRVTYLTWLGKENHDQYLAQQAARHAK